MDDPLKLLIVDDDEIARLAVRQALGEAGMGVEIDEEADPGRIMERLRTRSYDCILMDYSLPGTTGVDVIQALRRAGASTPVVVLTGDGNEDVAVAVMKAGAADYLPRAQGDAEHLIQRLRTAIRLHRAEARAQKALHELAAERELLEGVLEQMGAGVLIARAPRGELVLCNQKVEQILGQPYSLQNSAAGYASCRPAVYDGEGVLYTDERWPLARSLASGEVITGEEIECERPDGERVLLHASAAPVRDSRGEIIAAVMTLHDMTAERQAQDALRKKALLIETLHRIGSELASQLDQNKLVDAITREATQLTHAQLGVFYDNVIDDSGERYVDLRSAGQGSEPARMPGASGIPLRLAQAFRSTGVVRIDDITRDPRFAALELDPDMPALRSFLAVPVTSSSGQIIGGLFFGHDQPGAFRERDERIVAGIAGWAAVAMDNARLYEQAQHALHMRDEVLAVVSHDLRNPLNAIAIAAESLLHMDVTPEQRHRYVGAIRRGVGRANRLINDLLDASKIEAGKLSVETTRQTVSKLMEQAARDHEMMADKRGITLVVHAGAELPKVVVDRARILQVLDNLIGNAMRFTDAGGRIELAAELSGDSVHITVSDTGAGIPPEDLPQLFDRYWQTHQQHSAGAGLGLYIAKGIIEAHGSTLNVESQRGVGSTFRFALPVAW